MSAPAIQPEVRFEDRIQKMIEVLAMLSVGQFDITKVQFVTAAEDQLGMLEESMSMFAHELHSAKRENEDYVRKLESSQREMEEKLETIERQRLAIQDLSTPVIELWDDIITLPIVGIVDTQRSVEMTEKLLRRIVESRAKCVIIDVTGVDIVDTMTANHFLKMTKSARLLGAHCVVTGISPNIAQTLTQIGVDLEELPTLRSLKEGLKECFQYLRTKKLAATSAEAAQRK